MLPLFSTFFEDKFWAPRSECVCFWWDIQLCMCISWLGDPSCWYDGPVEDYSQIAISQTHCQWLISRWSREQNNHPGIWLTNELGSSHLRNFCCILKKWKKMLHPLSIVGHIISGASHLQEGMHQQTIHLLLITCDSSSLSSDFSPSTALLLLNQILHMLYRIWLHICDSSFTCSMLECFYTLVGVEYIFLIILDTNNFISDVCGF